jgi:hypothetical protein
LVGWLGTGLGYQMRCVRSGNEFLYLCFESKSCVLCLVSLCAVDC